jgi:COPII coat assembly protein SEC16
MEHTLSSDGDGGFGVEGGSWHPALRPDRHPSPRPAQPQVTSSLQEESVPGNLKHSELAEGGSWRPAFRPERDSFSASAPPIESQTEVAAPSRLDPLASSPVENQKSSRDYDASELLSDGDFPTDLAPATTLPSADDLRSPTSPPTEPPKPLLLQDEGLESHMATHTGLTNGWGDTEEGDTSFIHEEVEPSEDCTTALPDVPSTSHQDQPLNQHSDQGSLTNGDHDFPWDERDTVDPAWGMARTETDVFAHLRTVDRSNSFPEVPPLPQSQTQKHVDPLPASQVDTIAQEIEHTQESSERWDGMQPQYAQNANPVEASADPGSGFFDHLKDESEMLSPTPPEAESRFEEGLPLIPNESAEEHPQNVDLKEKWKDSFLGGAISSEDDFFNSSFPANGGMEDPRILDRKNTLQIFGAMEFSNHPNHHSNQIAAAVQPPASSDIHSQEMKAVPVTEDSWMTGGALAQEPPPEAPNDEDLDAMWKAALDDDELLEDDGEFLPDEWSGSQAVDEEPSFQRAMSENYADNSRSQTHQSGESYSEQSRPNAPRASSSSVSNPYAPHQPSSSILTQTPYSPTYGDFGTPQSTQPPPQKPGAPEHAASFADRSREGYQSPYDLPIDFARPKKKISMQPMASSAGVAAPPPPPRTSSLLSDRQVPLSASPRPSPALAPAPSFTPAQPTPPIQARPPPTTQVSGGPRSPEKAKPRTSSSSFFEELPMVSKPRPSTGMGRFTPQQNLPTPPPPPPVPQNIPPQPTQRPPLPPQQSSDAYAQYQLQPPERMDPYANIPPPAQNGPSPAGLAMRYSPRPPSNNAPQSTASNSRYSPAPPSQAGGPPSRNKYTAQPSAQPPPPIPIARPFQPRTSSPLALREETAYPPAAHRDENTYPVSPPSMAGTNQAAPQGAFNTDAPRSTSSDGPANDLYGSPLRQHTSQAQYQPRLPSIPSHQVPPRLQDAAQAYPYPPNEPLQPPASQGTSSSGPVSSYGAQYSSTQSAVDLPFSPPRRSQTQSPGKRAAGPPVAPSYQPPPRPASVHDPSSPTSMNPYTTFPAQSTGRARGLSQNLNFIPPNDGTEYDPLQRWRGSAIAGFGFGGILLSALPKHIPRYTTGHTVPMIKSSPGEIRLQTFKNLLPLEESSVSFPGPLRVKSKKKDVVTWISSKIDALEKNPWPQNSPGMLPDPQKRHEEKVLLWKVVKVMVEHDGQLEGSPEIQMALSKIISPELSAEDGSVNTPYSTGTYLTGISKSRGQMLQPEPMDPSALETVRKDLLRGDREKAVWAAVDRRLWAHAMLISSTVSKEVWKQVVQEFVRQEVKLVGENTESLAALYEIFAGNWQESIDELVPPSARAGLQMVSKVGNSGPTKNALDGLDRWRETLALVLSNRVPDDHQALAALGNLLASYGRVEAAHICQLFARSSSLPSSFGGLSDPQASIVLLGADHQRLPHDFAREEDSIMLTEVYEFAVSTLASSPSGNLPHLQAYKLQRALILAENGLKNEAQQYCDAIGNMLKSTTKMSPYYTPQLFEQLKDLDDRLRQAPSEGSSSWIFKPSMEKVSGSLWGKFSNFVAGDESDGESRGSGKAEGEFGPFAKVVGTPSISRSGSQTDLHAYGAYPMSSQSAPNTSSRYAPGPYAPRSSNEQIRSSHEYVRSSIEQSRPSIEQIRSSSEQAPSSIVQQGSSFEAPMSPPYAHTGFSQPPRPQTLEPTISNVGGQFGQQPSPYQPMSHSPNEPGGMYGYQPTPPQTSHSPMVPAEGFRDPSPQASYFPTPPNEPSPSFSGYQPQEPSPEPFTQPSQPERPSFIAPPSNAYEPTSSGGYEPPSYTPPSYEPDTQPDTSSPEDEKPRKKSFMDDDEDEDFSARSAAILREEKERKNREADDAFRKAAEADGAFTNCYPSRTHVANIPTAKKPDLHKKPSGWFGGWFGKKEGDIPTQGPIKAKLGEESSFVYDPKLKKWINKKDPNSANVASKSTPPPPRAGPPSRSTSGTGAPPPMGSGPLRSISSTLAPTGPPTSSPSLQPSASMPLLVGSTVLTPPLGGPPSLTASPQLQPHLQPTSTSSTPPQVSATPPIPPPSNPATPAPPGLNLGPALAPPSVPASRPGTAMSNASSIDDLLGAPAGRKTGGTVKGKKKGRGYIDVMAK